MQPTREISWRNIDYGTVAVFAVLVASISGQFATSGNLAPWYAELAKPSFDPPAGVFAPIWGALYLLMAFAAWRVTRLAPSPARRVALVLFFIQLALNAAWSWAFFAAHSPWLGLVDIVPQWLMIVATIVALARLDRIAALALVPLAAWVGYMCVLNYAIWRLNG
jgi:benzodiazapine receptor